MPDNFNFVGPNTPVQVVQQPHAQQPPAQPGVVYQQPPAQQQPAQQQRFAGGQPVQQQPPAPAPGYPQPGVVYQQPAQQPGYPQPGYQQPPAQPAVVRSPAQPAAMGYPQQAFDAYGQPIQPGFVQQPAPAPVAYQQPAPQQPVARQFAPQQPGQPGQPAPPVQQHQMPLPVGTPAQQAVRALQAVNPMHVDPNYAAQFPGVDYESAVRAMGGSPAGMPQPGMFSDGQMRYAANGVDSAGIPTDPAQFRAAMTEAMGNTPEAARMADVMAQMMDHKIRSLGLDRVDRSKLAFPETHATAERSDLAKEVFSRTGIAPTPKAQAMDAWMRFVLFGRDFRQHENHDVRNVVYRALSEGIDSEGGYIVPSGFVAEIVRDAPKLSGLYQFCRRIPVNIMSGEIPSVAKNAGVSWGTEGIKFGEDDPALGSKNFAIKRLNALVKQSRELVNDSNPSIVDLVVDLFREQIVEERDRVVSLGDGSAEPLGLYNSPAILDKSADIQAVNWANLVNMYDAVDNRYTMSPSFRWWFNQHVKAKIMKLVDNEGRPLIQLDPTAGFTPRLFNHPIAIENHLPNTYMGIGDLRYYMIFDRETLGIERSTEAGDAFETHQLMIKFWERWDGKPVTPKTRPMAHTKQLDLSA